MIAIAPETGRMKPDLYRIRMLRSGVEVDVPKDIAMKLTESGDAGWVGEWHPAPSERKPAGPTEIKNG